MEQSDAIAIYALVIITGLTDGWYTFRFALFVLWRLGKVAITWNMALGLLLALTTGLSAVIFAVATQMHKLTGSFSYLPATFIASAFSGGLAFQGWYLFRASRARDHQ